MNKIFIALLFCVFFCKIAVGQHVNNYQLKDKFQTGEAMSTIEILSNGDTVLNSKVSYKNNITNNIEINEKIFKGTPLYGNAWFTNGTIFVDGLLTKGTLAYNLVNNEVQFSLADVSKALTVKPDSFIVNNIKFSKLKKKYNGSFMGYYQSVFNKNNLQLYRQYSSNYRPAVTGQKTGYEMAVNEYEGTYAKSTSLYLALADDWMEIKLNKSVFKNFADKKDAVEKYAKENNLNVKKEIDLIQILLHYSTLIN